MKTKSLRNLSMRRASGSSSSPMGALSRESLESNKNSKASPNPWPVYRYSSSFENRAGFIDVLRRRSALDPVPTTVDCVGDDDRNGEGVRDSAGADISRPKPRDTAEPGG